MFIFVLIIKLYMLILLFRLVTTAQELRFNPLGQLVGKFTDPIFKNLKINNKQVSFVIPLLIIGLIILSSFLDFFIGGKNNLGKDFIIMLLSHTSLYLQFFMLFFIVCIILGSFVNKVAMSSYINFFFRLGLPWVKLTRVFVPVSSGKIIYPSMLVVFLVYLILGFGLEFLNGAYQGSLSSVSSLKTYLLLPLKAGLFALTGLFSYASWAIFFRAIISWVNPDMRNPVFQLLYTLTEPIISLFRKFIPPFGMLDLSALAAIIVLNVFAVVLKNFINLI